MLSYASAVMPIYHATKQSYVLTTKLRILGQIRFQWIVVVAVLLWSAQITLVMPDSKETDSI